MNALAWFLVLSGVGLVLLTVLLPPRGGNHDDDEGNSE